MINLISKKEFLKNNKKPEQEGVWDNISDLWNDYRKEAFDVIKEFLKDKKGKVIDLGCGSGRNMIANKNIEYYGVDFSSNQLKCAEKITSEKKINTKLFKADVSELDKDIFKNEMFDYGLFIAALHCIEGEKQRENALGEFYRVLKKNAEALVSVWNSEDPRFNNIENKGDIYMSWKKDGKEHMRYYYLYSKEELIKLLEKVGFRILKIYDKSEDRFSKKNWIIRVKK